MRVSVELPDPPRLEPLLESLSQQYAEVMRRLLELQQRDHMTPMMQAMQAQQDGLVQAFQTMLSAMQQGKQQDHQAMQEMMRQEVAAPQQEASDALLSAIRGMKRSLSSLPESLGDAMNKNMKARQRHLMMEKPEKMAPRQPDPSRAIVRKLDEMESVLANAMRGSRNRTFGSNY